MTSSVDNNSIKLEDGQVSDSNEVRDKETFASKVEQPEEKQESHRNEPGEPAINQDAVIDNKVTKNTWLWRIAVVAVLLLVVGGILGIIISKSQNSSGPIENEKEVGKAREELVELTNLADMEEFLQKPLSERTYELLAQNGFVVRANENDYSRIDPEGFTHQSDDWTALYADFGGGSVCERRSANAVFVSSDFLLHTYHRLFDNQLKYLEVVSFGPKLYDLSQKLLEYGIEQAQQTTDFQTRESWQRINAFLAVGLSQFDSSLYETDSIYSTTPRGVYQTEIDLETIKTRLENELCPRVGEVACDLARQELELILVADAVTGSPLFAETETDYTQYSPRGHYSENAILQSYFRTMMWYGRSNFLLSGPNSKHLGSVVC